jgi:predicted glutamine amidotransferase
MCELFGMSSRSSAEVNLCLDELALHGGRTGPHRDGWGLAYYEEHDVRIIREPGSASGSNWIRFIEQQHIASRMVLGHIRLATQGGVSLHNTQPFARELGGRMHVFAHNGDLPAIFDDPRFEPGYSRPIGQTDSEYAFCDLLRRLEPSCRRGRPAAQERLALFANFVEELATLGPANLLYSDGDTLFAHSHRRREGPGQPFHPRRSAPAPAQRRADPGPAPRAGPPHRRRRPESAGCHACERPPDAGDLAAARRGHGPRHPGRRSLRRTARCHRQLTHAELEFSFACLQV